MPDSNRDSNLKQSGNGGSIIGNKGAAAGSGGWSFEGPGTLRLKF